MANSIPLPTFTLFNEFHKNLTNEEIDSLVKKCHIVLEECVIGMQTIGKLVFTASHSSEIDLAEVESIGHLFRNMGEQSQDLLMVIQLAEQVKEKRRKIIH